MASYGSSVPIDFSLNQRRLPRSQVERIPTVDDWEDDDLSARDEEEPDHEVGSLASSLRANFLPPTTRLLSATDPAFERYKSIGSPSPGSSFLSPVFSHLPSVKPSRLTVASDDAQKLRRKLLRGANLLVIQGGYSGKRFIYERLKELGVSVTIMDGPDTVWHAAAEEGLIAEFIEIDFTEHSTVFQRAMDIVLSLENSFDGVTTFYEEAGMSVLSLKRGCVAYALCALRGVTCVACMLKRFRCRSRSRWLLCWTVCQSRAHSDLPLFSLLCDFLCVFMLLFGLLRPSFACIISTITRSYPQSLWQPVLRPPWAWRQTPSRRATRLATSASRGKSWPTVVCRSPGSAQFVQRRTCCQRASWLASLPSSSPSLASPPWASLA